MTFRCEDLPDFGLVLVPPSSPDYEPLFADIQRRVDHSLEKRETSAILVNQSEKSIRCHPMLSGVTKISPGTSLTARR